MDTGQGRASEALRNGCYRSGRSCISRTAFAMWRHVLATAGRLLSSACLARARAMASATAPCSVMRFRAARATSGSVAISDYGAHGDRFANKKPHSIAAAEPSVTSRDIPESVTLDPCVHRVARGAEKRVTLATMTLAPLSLLFSLQCGWINKGKTRTDPDCHTD